jgi:hypothetical protein
MPAYTFKCENDHSQQQITTTKIKTIPCPSCGEPATRQLPKLAGPADTEEVINKYTGVKWRDDQRDQVKERNDKYYWEVEVPRFVQSGIYTVETMLENGWIILEDSGTVTVQNKPPSAR